MNLHKNVNLFEDVLNATAKHVNLPVLYIEKDYWVTYVLKRLSESEYKGIAIFKGGTSLSKAYKLIDRFSEDIDLAVITNDLSSNQIKTLIKKIEKTLLDENFSEVSNHRQVSKGSEFRKTVHDYPKLENGDFGHAVESIIIELNSFAQPHPYEPKEISTYIFDFLALNAIEIVDEYELEPFEINVLDYRRTLCEKISAIARASHENDALNSSLKEKIRHFYDIYFLTQQEELKEFLNSHDFAEMMHLVRVDDRAQFSASDWSAIPLHDTKIFINVKETLAQLESFYKNDFKDLVYAQTLPEMQDIIVEIENISAILKKKRL
jgi:hypothetical protein